MTSLRQATDQEEFKIVDSYLDFLKSEGIPVVESYSVDCLSLPLEPWARTGGLGSYVHLVGKGDYCSCYVAEIPAGGRLQPEKHLHDEAIYVFKGHGTTAIEMPDGTTRSFEWGPHSAFAIPMNATHRLSNASSTEPARFAAVTNLPIILNLFHNIDFVFNNPSVFRERFGEDAFYRGGGKADPLSTRSAHWETILVKDMSTFKLADAKDRGADGHSITLTFADSALHSHSAGFPAGTYKKSHRHGAGAHIFIVTGHGYSLLWKDGEDPLGAVYIEWKPGTLLAPPHGPTFHQHFNTSPQTARYLVFGMDIGISRYPVFESRRLEILSHQRERSVNEGGDQIEYEDEDPRILERFEAECAKHGVRSRMREFIKRR